MKGRIATAVVGAVILGLIAPLAAHPTMASAVAGQASAPTPAPEPTAPAPEPTASAPVPTPTPEPTAPAPIPEPSAPAPIPEPSAPASGETPQVQAEARTSVAAAIAPTIPTASRVAGIDRYATSIAASAAAFPAGASTVLVVNGLAGVDGAIAASMAAQLGAPLLYVQHGSVPAAVLTEIRRLAPQSIVVIGGTGVVAEGVLTQLRSVAPEVRRFGGADRYETSRLALSGRGGAFPVVYVSGGANLVDAPLASVAAAATDRAALLVNGTAAVDGATLAALRAAGAGTAIIVGGTNTVTTAYEAGLRAAGFAVERRAGADRFAQAVLMARERTTAPLRAMVVNPATDPDVAVATALAAVTRQPLLYAIEKCVPDVAAAHVSGSGLAITGVGGPFWLEPAVLSNSRCSTVKATLQSQLNAVIRAEMARYRGTFSVTVRQIGGLGEITHVDGGVRREPASMIKVFAAWAAYRRVEEGRATLSTVLPSGVPLGTCIHVMIHVSDNYCHTDIVHWIGIPQLNAMIRGVGFTNTFYGSVPAGTSVLYAGNRSSSNDLAWFVDRLVNGNMLTKPHTDALLAEMGMQIGRSRIASGIPPTARQASKPGALWIASGLMQGDNAVVHGSRYSYALAIVGDDGPDQAAFRAISRAVYEHFHGQFGTAMSYPREQMVTRTPSLLRSSPGGPIVATIPAGVILEQLESQRVWYEVQYGSRRLWVYHSGLRNR